jgi:hypothetical protein
MYMSTYISMPSIQILVNYLIFHNELFVNNLFISN